MAARAAAAPGYLGMNSAREPGGIGITVSWWCDRAAATAWRDDPGHVRIREAGRARWYSWYRLTVAEVERGYAWARDGADAQSPRLDRGTAGLFGVDGGRRSPRAIERRHAMNDDAQRHQVDHNYDAFQRTLALLLPEHAGEYALMRDGDVIAFYRSPGDAYRAGVTRYADQLFSIQEITDEPIDLGFWSHVQA